VTPAGDLYAAALVHRGHSGARKAWFSARALAAELSGGFLSEPRSADVVVRAHTWSAPLARIAVDTHEAGGVLRKVQDDLDRLDVSTFRQQWGVR